MDVLDQHTHEQLGFLVDVSQGGLMLISQNPIPPDQIKDIYIETNIGDENEPHPPIKMQIVSVWNRPNINPVLTCIGCKVTAIDPNDEHWLLKLAESLSFAPDVTVNRIIHDT
jgi:hypothetical protein